MPFGASIHIGVNTPAELGGERPLQFSEAMAWRMAGLAEQARFGSISVLRGAAATRASVQDALTAAARTLAGGDTLLVTFSGHGNQVRNLDMELDKGDGCNDDECWCLADGNLVDDELACCWRRFAPGVRVVVVSESCYSGGVGRDDELTGCVPPARQQGRSTFRGRGGYRDGEEAWSPAADNSPCVSPRRDADGIGASVLLLSASRENQKARDGLYSRHLLQAWDEGLFRHSYCALHRRVRECVMRENPRQEPQISMLGTANPALPLEPAFHLGLGGPSRSRGWG